ncbi:MAG: hypothetical protein ABSF69_23905 [Polyangiaceae bacterium]|jgi:hypothetical protein
MNKPPFQKPSSSTKADKPEAKAGTDVQTSPAASTPAADAPKIAVADVAALTDADLIATLKTLRTELRRRESAREALRPRAGSQVRIVRGPAKYVGKTGTAVIVRKSRCFVSVPEIAQPAYVLITDVELVQQ